MNGAARKRGIGTAGDRQGTEACGAVVLVVPGAVATADCKVAPQKLQVLVAF